VPVPLQSPILTVSARPECGDRQHALRQDRRRGRRLHPHALAEDRLHLPRSARIV